MKIKIMIIYLLMSLHSAYAAISNTAQVVDLVVTCGVSQDNCFEDVGVLFDWIEGVRRPDTSLPLTVNIGNGVFLVKDTGFTQDLSYVLNCDGQNFTGYVSFIGQGANNSVIQIGVDQQLAGFFDVTGGCEGMHFSNLAFRVVADYGYIRWKDGGTSRWDSVEVFGRGGAWSDLSCAANNEGEHYWYSSKMSTTPMYNASRVYGAACDKTWVFGSELTSIVPAGIDATNNNVIEVYSFNSSNNPEVHLYGSNIRAISHGDVSNAQSNGRGTVYAGNNGKVHIHGTGIDSINTTGQDMFVLVAENGGFIHANESSYVIKTTGSVTRIDVDAGSIIKAPYSWEQGDSPPAITSVDGADSFIDTSGSFPMMYIYNNNCQLSGGPWVGVTGQCRL